MPSGLPQLVPHRGKLSPTLRLTYLRLRAATSRPSGSVDCHSAPLGEQAVADPRVAGHRDLAPGRLAQLVQRLGVRLGAVLGQRAVDAHAVDARARARRELVVELGGLLLLHARVGIERAPALLDAAVDAVDAPVAALLRHPLAVALGRLDMHAERERARRLHHVKQPAEPRLLGCQGDVEGLHGGGADQQVRAVGEAEVGGADRLRQSACAGARILGALAGDQRLHHLRAHEARGQLARELAVGIKASVQQVEHLRAVERPCGQAHRLQIAAHAFCVAQAVAHRTLVCGGLDPPRPPTGAAHAQGGAPALPGADHQIAQAHRGDAQRVQADRLLLGDPQPADRPRALVLAEVFGGAGRLLAAMGLLREHVLELKRRALDVELQRLAVGQPRGELRKRGGDPLALGLVDDERVDRADLQVAHVRAVLAHEQSVVVDRRDSEQLGRRARGPHRSQRSSESSSSSAGSARIAREPRRQGAPRSGRQDHDPARAPEKPAGTAGRN